MKKRFLRTSISSIICQIFVIFMFIGGINAIILLVKILISGDLETPKETALFIFLTTACCFGELGVFHTELDFLIGNICLSEYGISTIGDIRHGRNKIQYPVSIDYCEISEVKIVPLNRNSKGKKIYKPRPLPF